MFVVFSVAQNQYNLLTMTNSKKIIIVATLIHLAAIVYGIISGLWDAVILATVFLVASLLYSFNKDKKD